MNHVGIAGKSVLGGRKSECREGMNKRHLRNSKKATVSESEQMDA